MQEYEQHEIGKCYPPLTESEKRLLNAQLLAPGPKSKVILMDNKILDGWHQYLISKELGIECEFEEVNPEDPVAFVIGRNEGRRHLTDDQRAMIAVELAELKRRAPWRPFGAITIKSSNSKTYSHASTPELIETAKAQRVSISRAARARRAKKLDPGCVVAIRNGEMKIAKVVGPLEKAGRGKKGGTSQKILPPIRPEPVRPGTIKFPSAEETGFPVDGTMAERDAHHRKYGRTPIYPKAIADILMHGRLVNGYVGSIAMASSDSHPSLDQFFAAIDAMLAWVPDSQKGGQWASDFAGKARRELRRLEERIPILCERLIKIQQLLAERKTVPR